MLNKPASIRFIFYPTRGGGTHRARLSARFPRGPASKRPKNFVFGTGWPGLGLFATHKQKRDQPRGNSLRRK